MISRRACQTSSLNSNSVSVVFATYDILKGYIQGLYLSNRSCEDDLVVVKGNTTMQKGFEAQSATSSLAQLIMHSGYEYT